MAAFRSATRRDALEGDGCYAVRGQKPKGVGGAASAGRGARSGHRCCCPSRTTRRRPPRGSSPRSGAAGPPQGDFARSTSTTTRTSSSGARVESEDDEEELWAYGHRRRARRTRADGPGSWLPSRWAAAGGGAPPDGTPGRRSRPGRTSAPCRSSTWPSGEPELKLKSAKRNHGFGLGTVGCIESRRRRSLALPSGFRSLND